MVRGNIIKQEILKNSFRAVKDDIFEIKDKIDSNQDKFNEFKIKIDENLDGIKKDFKSEFEKLGEGFEDVKNGFRADLEKLNEDIKGKLNLTNTNINGLNSILINFEREIDEYKKKFERLNSDFEVKAKLTKQISSLIKDVYKVTEKVNMINNVYSDLRLRFEGVNEKVKDLDSNFNKKINELKNLIERNELDVKKKLEKLNSDLEISKIEDETKINDSVKELDKKLYKIQSDELKERLKIKENFDNLNLEFNKEKNKNENRLGFYDSKFNDFRVDIEKIKSSDLDFDRKIKEVSKLIENKDKELNKKLGKIQEFNSEERLAVKEGLESLKIDLGKEKGKIENRLGFYDNRFNDFRIEINKIKKDVSDKLSQDDLRIKKQNDVFNNLVKDIFKANEKIAVVNNVYADLYSRFEKLNKRVSWVEDLEKRFKKFEKKEDKDKKENSNGNVNKRKGLLKEKFDKAVKILANME